MRVQRHTPEPMRSQGATGHSLAGLELPPCISPKQAAEDRKAFMESAKRAPSPKPKGTRPTYTPEEKAEFRVRGLELQALGISAAASAREIGINKETLKTILGDDYVPHVRGKKPAREYDRTDYWRDYKRQQRKEGKAA